MEGFKKYPALRDVLLKTAASWMRGRSMDDGYHPFWRVHDKLYDLAAFAGRHPGGRQWIEATRGTDVTEAFESSHLSPSVYCLLDKFEVDTVETPRNSPFTFETNGFYLTLKRRVHRCLSQLAPESKLRYKERVKTIQNAMLSCFVVLLIGAGVTQHYPLAVAAGLLLTVNVNCAHNYFHQRDNWRMYGFDLSLLSSSEWRITHALSHHLFTNTIWDFELSGFEPFTDFRVREKTRFHRFALLAAFFVFPLVIFPTEGLKRLAMTLLGKQKLRPENLLSISQVLVLWLSGCQLVKALELWLVIQTVAGYAFGVVGLTAAHHHTDLYHTGDGRFQFGNDWGLAQLDAVGDRCDVNGHLAAELAAFGNHALHHLFPTLDHGLLIAVGPVFEATCREFGLPKRVTSAGHYTQWQLVRGTLGQLVRTKPRPPPRDAIPEQPR